VKATIHPNYEEATIRCTCGNEVKTRSTKANMHLDVCDVCHPFFTGEQRIVDTAGRVERFNRRYARPGQ
jgi:large subunit ribosomal protein L31